MRVEGGSFRRVYVTMFRWSVSVVGSRFFHGMLWALFGVFLRCWILDM